MKSSFSNSNSHSNPDPDPPPPYSLASPAPVPSAAKPNQISHSTARPSQASSSIPTHYQTRLFHIYHTDILNRSHQVLDSDKVTPLYTYTTRQSALFNTRPQLEIFRGASSTDCIATGMFHMGYVELHIHGRDVPLSRNGIFSYTHVFDSSGMGKLDWARDSVFGSDMTLSDESKQTVARFHNAAYSVRKEGKLEIMGGDIGSVIIDEIVVTGLAMVEWERRQRRS
ncbi:hypothetical protein MMC12_001073 [Toensbergia leucococca]|nr:hypothetical protein [Toensbergia leucococca]